MFWLNIPFVYRTHDEPDEEKLIHFNEFVHNLGYVVKWEKKLHPKALQEIIAKIKGTKEETVVSTLLLRSMKQARYTSDCTGHFGLAAKYYCHFTSPIRRYPDLIIHRIIKMTLNGQLDENKTKKLTTEVDNAAIQSSDTERVAQEAEREVDDLKKAEYMQDKIGEYFNGIISSVTGFGIFIQLPNTVEGLVHISAMDDDYYVYDERHLCLIGERTKNIYRLGDEMRIKVSRVDIATKEIYFDIVKDDDNEDEEVDVRRTKKSNKIQTLDEFEKNVTNEWIENIDSEE